jgi:hypothetical protein
LAGTGSARPRLTAARRVGHQLSADNNLRTIWKIRDKMLKTKNVLFLLSVFIPIILLEILARTAFVEPPYMFIPSTDFRLIYELNPHYQEINSFGMRQEEFEPSTLRHQFVIAVVGDSHSFSFASENWKNSFPARLEHHLKALTGESIKVLNFGVPGYDMVQELEVLKVKALKFKPDLIVLQYCINDDHIPNYIQPKYGWLNQAIHSSQLLSRAWKEFLYSSYGKKYVLSYVETYLPDLLLYRPGLVGTPRARGEKDPAHFPHPPRSRDQVPMRYWDFIGRENFERAVKVFGTISKAAGIPALATGFIEDRDRNLYEASGFQVYSFFQIFHGLDMREYGYNPAATWTHFSDKGSDFIGKALADYIATNFSLSRNARTVDTSMGRQLK